MPYTRTTTRALTPAENLEIDKVFDSIGCGSTQVRADFKARFALLKTDEERQLILDLTRRFIFIPLSDYGKHLLPTVERIHNSIGSKKLIAVMNGLPKSDFGKIKSNYLVSYQFKGLNLIQNINWGKHQPGIIDDFKSLLQIPNLQDFELLLVDDFIGSGETIEGTYNYILHRLGAHGKPVPHTSVVCIVAMQQAIDLLRNKMGIEVYASIIENRGISDYYKEPQLTKAISLMTDIEKRLKVKPHYKFGYNQSEALVCMERCPNNTFPFYWIKTKHEYAPFRR